MLASGNEHYRGTVEKVPRYSGMPQYGPAGGTVGEEE